jgi:hypothetical protein
MEVNASNDVALQIIPRIERLVAILEYEGKSDYVLTIL